jgi:putative endonuclease
VSFVGQVRLRPFVARRRPSLGGLFFLCLPKLPPYIPAQPPGSCCIFIQAFPLELPDHYKTNQLYTTETKDVLSIRVDDPDTKAAYDPPALHFVYIIVSVSYPERYYVGLTNNVRRRLSHHNQGIVRSTAPFRPWRLRTAICFAKRHRALEFERYLKTGSGIAFLRKRFL